MTAYKLTKGLTLWLTGLSGAGKTTLANKLTELLGEYRAEMRYEVLDGDDIRDNLNQELGFTRSDRMVNIKRIAFLASKISKHQVLTIVPSIAPYIEARELARSLNPEFLLVYIKASIAEVSKRDVKGLYKKALNGEIDNFTGISDPYDEPEDADLVVDTEKLSIEEAARQIIELLITKKVIQI
jgi:adenylyl-sulfate kinase